VHWLVSELRRYQNARCNDKNDWFHVTLMHLWVQVLPSCELLCNNFRNFDLICIPASVFSVVMFRWYSYRFHYSDLIQWYGPV
jgi:hypothetical protein